MTKLVAAYAGGAIMTKLPIGDGGVEGEQRGGTCGLYSLWYASKLLKIINPGDGRQEIFSRKGTNTGDVSSRAFSKTLGSGQGEILNWQEMSAIIRHFGWDCDIADSPDEAARRRFITFCLDKDRPILFAYMEGGNPGSTCHPIRAYDAAYKDGCGSHWALLIQETAREYGFIDPHWPNTLRSESKDTILHSNAAADGGPGFSRHEAVASRSRKLGDTMKTKTYDLGDTKARQGLANLLISVF